MARLWPIALPSTPQAPLSVRLPSLEAVSDQVWLSPPHLAGGEMAAVQTTLLAGWVAPAGPVPLAFEAAIAAVTEFPHVVAVASGTAALHLAYCCLSLQPGDEVWTSTLTFVASIAPAVQMGARPRFLDVCPASWTLDPNLLEAALAKAGRSGKLPRVVVPVDLYGQCSDLASIRAICDRWGVAVLSDSAGGMGAMQRGRHAGIGAHLAAFSFNGNKIITAGGGGALASEDPALIARARHLATQAKEPGPHYQHETTGFSYGISSVLAAVGLAQLPALEDRVLARRAVFEGYRRGLAGLPGIAFMPEPAWGRSSRWLSAIQINPESFGADRETVRRALAAANIESRPVWKPLHLQPVFRGVGQNKAQKGENVAARLFEQGLCLPSGSALTAVDQARIIGIIHDCHVG